uniref:Uncharacterized protein n=1 Tax=Chromera velia CCMP2878 TaxID=1169474 RepID=A0A0G4I2W9_9ALVE|eukprot:Cvel_10453.t1-p1 / transcript=Cvel_10453.t1 / gene=Cvel_10453 / organism=Chromera_velia_CCMP2878 / gene_product=hypothetical protein / transcript_product=hypothetical protein / location=Cvel_scaffold629:56651-57283(+) / protein_length=211 / sequence_SO=supercontig / SO=protein_coding / is_pseudo=false
MADTPLTDEQQGMIAEIYEHFASQRDGGMTIDGLKQLNQLTCGKEFPFEDLNQFNQAIGGLMPLAGGVMSAFDLAVAYKISCMQSPMQVHKDYAILAPTGRLKPCAYMSDSNVMAIMMVKEIFDAFAKNGVMDTEGAKEHWEITRGEKWPFQSLQAMKAARLLNFLKLEGGNLSLDDMLALYQTSGKGWDLVKDYKLLKEKYKIPGKVELA